MLSRMRVLGPDEVQVRCRTTEHFDEAALGEAVALLSPAERARYRRFRFARDRRDYAAAHALLRTSLSRFGAPAPEAWTFAAHARGKPSLASGAAASLSFNLSHTHGMVACAIAPGADIGVDVERVDRPLDEEALATRFFATVEQAHLRRCAPAQRAIRFFELWTLKEAYLKAIGVGLSHSLSEMAFELDDGHGIAFVPPPGIDSRSWQFALFEPAPRYRLAVAVRRTRGEPWRITATVIASGHEASVAAVRTSVG